MGLAEGPHPPEHGGALIPAALLWVGLGRAASPDPATVAISTETIALVRPGERVQLYDRASGTLAWQLPLGLGRDGWHQRKSPSN